MTFLIGTSGPLLLVNTRLARMCSSSSLRSIIRSCAVNVRPPPPPCTLCGAHTFHTSNNMLHKRTAERKKIEYKKKQGAYVNVWRNMTVAELAKSLGKSVDHVFEVLLYIKDADAYDDTHVAIDNMRVINDIVRRSGAKSRVVSTPEKRPVDSVNLDAVPRPPPGDPSSLPRRPPVVTIMGHVDHGKTTLLDALRRSRIVDAEFGGITQHIGAFTVTMNGERVTFLDTPGHAAFASMRQRGARVTDLVVLVVAADDGVMEQTRQSIEYAASAGVPILVAINKCDRPNADVEATRRSLMSAGVQLEGMGGDVPYVQISALKGDGIPEMTEAILASAEMLDLRADRHGLVEGCVLESRTDLNRGKLSTTLVHRGTLRRGCVLVAGRAWCKVRVMLDETGRPVQEAGPSTAVEVLGWRDLPSAGETVLEVETERRAREVVAWRCEQTATQRALVDHEAAQHKLEQHLQEYRSQRQQKLDLGIRYKMRSTANRKKEAVDVKEGPALHVVIKGDVDGSVEAILDTLDTYEECEVRLQLLHYGVGDVNENDVKIAQLFNGIVYAFNVAVPPVVKSRAAAAGVSIRPSNVIYRLMEDLKRELDQLMPIKHVAEVVGEADVMQEFMVTEKKSKRPVAGCRCVHGVLKKELSFRLMRDEEIIYDGSLSSMRHLKNEVSSVKKDVECGLMLEDKTVRVRPGDRLVCYQVAECTQQCPWDPGFHLQT